MFANISNKSYLEASLNPLTWASGNDTSTRGSRSFANSQSAKVTNIQSSKAFCQRNRSIPTPYILMDNQSTFNVFYNPVLLCNIRASDYTLHLISNSGTVPINKKFDLLGCGPVWYHSKSIANILGLYNVYDNDKYWIRYDSRESQDFVVAHANDRKKTCFRRAPCGLHWLYTKATKTSEDGEVLINTVENNISSYTR